MKRNLILLMLCASSLIACKNNINEVTPVTEPEEIIVYERNPEYPWVEPTPTIKTKAPIKNNNYMGYTFKTTEYPLESPNNIGEVSVIDIPKLERDYPSYVTSFGIHQSISNSFSFTNFDRYEEFSKTSKKVSAGFELKLGFLKLGAKKSYETVFEQSQISQSQHVFGELQILIKDSLHRVSMNQHIKNMVKANYLTNDFKNIMYNVMPSDFCTGNGFFVLTNYSTGGRLQVVYSGISKENTTTEKKEESMNRAISASVTFKENSGSGDLSIGNGNGSSNSETNKFSSLLFSMKSMGGVAPHLDFSGTQDINSQKIDLTAWRSSLADKKYSVLIEVADGSLYPITDFIIGDNLKLLYNNYISPKGLQIYRPSAPDKIQEPEVIASQGSNGSYTILLKTRFNANISLGTVTESALSARLSDLRDCFGIKTTIKKYTILIAPGGLIGYPGTPSTNMNYKYESGGLVVISGSGTTFGEFDKSLMKKFIDPNTGETFITLVNNSGNKLAYYIYSKNIMDAYAMSPFVNNLPTETRYNKDQIISSFKILAL